MILIFWDSYFSLVLTWGVISATGGTVRHVRSYCGMVSPRQLDRKLIHQGGKGTPRPRTADDEEGRGERSGENSLGFSFLGFAREGMAAFLVGILFHIFVISHISNRHITSWHCNVRDYHAVGMKMTRLERRSRSSTVSY